MQKSITASVAALIGWLILCLAAQSRAQSPTRYEQPPLLRISTQSTQDFFGLPIHWSDSEAVLLEPTGRMHHFSQSDIAKHQLLERAFKPQSSIEASQQLQKELGPEFEVIANGPYVLAAPISHASRWRDRFQSLHAGYNRYFEVRGWPLRQPDFPLVVIVQPNRRAFQRYVASEQSHPGANVVGSYFPKSNRCVLYELDSASGIDWAETEATIVHEAVHQLAFNTGVHERLAENPLWLVEGFATMFEQPAVYDSRTNRSNVESRMLAKKVIELQPILREPGALERCLRSMVESDRFFQQQPFDAYNIAWALTFYLSERMPNEFAAYLQIQQNRNFGGYSNAARTRDFQKAIGLDAAQLAISMQRMFQR